jgi:hypothetical protein
VVSSSSARAGHTAAVAVGIEGSSPATAARCSAAHQRTATARV